MPKSLLLVLVNKLLSVFMNRDEFLILQIMLQIDMSKKNKNLHREANQLQGLQISELLPH